MTNENMKLAKYKLITLHEETILKYNYDLMKIFIKTEKLI